MPIKFYAKSMSRGAKSNYSKETADQKTQFFTKKETSMHISNELSQLRSVAKRTDQKQLVYFLEMAMHQAQYDCLQDLK